MLFFENIFAHSISIYDFILFAVSFYFGIRSLCDLYNRLGFSFNDSFPYQVHLRRFYWNSIEFLLNNTTHTFFFIFINDFIAFTSFIYRLLLKQILSLFILVTNGSFNIVAFKIWSTLLLNVTIDLPTLILSLICLSMSIIGWKLSARRLF